MKTIFLFLAALSFSSPLFASELIVACTETSLSGVFEQCEEIVIMQKLGDRVRAYSKPKQIVLSLKLSSIFIAKSPEAAEKIFAGQKIMVPAERLWNTSRGGFQSLCEIQEIKKSKYERDPLLTVSCGRYRNQTISRQNIFVLKPYLTAASVKEKS